MSGSSLPSKQEQSALLKHRLGVSLEKVAELCQSHSIQRLAVFGSILTDDFKSGSDVDFLVSTLPDLRLTLSYHQSLEQNLGQMVNRKVDLVFMRNLEKSENWIKKESIINSAEVIYNISLSE